MEARSLTASKDSKDCSFGQKDCDLFFWDANDIIMTQGYNLQ